MAFYSANVSAFLYIGASTAASLPAPGSDSFTEVGLVGSITPPSNTISTAFFNVLNDPDRRSVGGKLGDRTVAVTLVVDWTTTPHQNMYSDSSVAGGQKRNWRIVYPDANDRQLDFVGFISEWTEEAFDAGEDAKEHRVSVVITVDGDLTVTA
jgi:hypothetical protein